MILRVASRPINVRHQFVYQLPLYIGFLIIWQLIAARLYPQLSPLRIVEALVTYVPKREFMVSLGASVKRIAIGYAVASVLGITVGITIGLNRWLGSIFDPLWSFMRPISPLAWVPLSIVWFGVTEKAAIFVIAYAAFFPILLNTLTGVRQVPPIYAEVAQTLGANRLQAAREVVLPAAIPHILTGLRIAMGLSWAVIVAAELAIGFVLQAGIGYLMHKYTMFVFNIPRVTALVILVGVIGLLLDWSLRRIADKLTPWRRTSSREA